MFSKSFLVPSNLFDFGTLSLPVPGQQHLAEVGSIVHPSIGPHLCVPSQTQPWSSPELQPLLHYSLHCSRPSQLVWTLAGTTSWDKVSSLSSMEGPLDEDGEPEWSAISNSSLCTVPECINRPTIHVVICGELSLLANAYYSIPSEIRKQHQFQKQYLDHSSFCYLAKHLGARLRWFFFNICCFILIVINFG